MKLKIPYYQNLDDRHCWPACIKMALEYIFHKKFSWQKIDKIVEMPPAPLWPWPSNALVNLKKMGLKVKYYIKCIEYFIGIANQGKKYLASVYSPKVANDIIKHTDFDLVRKGIKNALSEKIFEERDLTLRDLAKFLKSRKVVICLLNWNVIERKDGYRGHVLLLTGLDEKFVYAHNPTTPQEAPQPNQKFEKELFMKAWRAEGADGDAYVIWK